MADYTFLQYETFDNGAIVRILLDRPGARNAQNRGLLVELDEAFLHAEADDPCRVVILGGTGPLFSSGHDMGSKVAIEDYQTHTTSHVRVGNTMLEATDVEAQLLKRDLQGFGQRQSACRALVEANFRLGGLIAVAVWSELGDCRRFSRSEQVVRHSGLDVSVDASDRHRAPWLPDPAGTADVALGAVRSGDERVTPAQPRPHLLHDGDGPSRRQARRHCGGWQFARCCYHILRNLDPDVVYAMPSAA